MFKSYLRKWFVFRKSNRSATANVGQPVTPPEKEVKAGEVPPAVVDTAAPANVVKREEVHESTLRSEDISSIQQQQGTPLRGVDEYERTVTTSSEECDKNSSNNNNNNNDDFIFEEEQKVPLSTLGKSSGVAVAFSGHSEGNNGGSAPNNCNRNINNTDSNSKGCSSISCSSSNSNGKGNLYGTGDFYMKFGSLDSEGLENLPTQLSKSGRIAMASPHSCRDRLISDESPSRYAQQREEGGYMHFAPFTQKISVAPPNDQLVVLCYDDDDDDTEVTGSTLDEPMTPQSFSSVMRSNMLKRKTNPITTGHYNSCSNYKKEKMGDLGNRVCTPSRELENCCINESKSFSLNCSCSTCGRQYAGCELRQGEFGLIETNAHYYEYGRPPFSVPTTSTIELANRGASATARMLRGCKDMDSAAELRQSGSSRLWQVSSLPPEPKELTNVNVGRLRSLALKRHVLECTSVDKHPVGNYQKLLNDKYVIYSKWNLGVGSYSKVLLCFNLEDEVYYAMKVLDRVRLQRKGLGVDCALHKVRREIAIMKKLRHRNIVKLVEVIDDPRSRKIYLVLELAEHGEIMSLRDDGTVMPIDGNTTLQEREVVRVMRSIVSAAMYAHRLGIAHRDIKPQNILLTAEGDVKLSDFGVSIIVDDSSARVRREGSVAFLPPEMLVSSEVQVVPPAASLHTEVCKNENNENNQATPISVATATAAAGSIKETTPSFGVMRICPLSISLCTSAAETLEEVAHPASAPSFAHTWATAAHTLRDSCVGTTAPAPQVDLFKADVFSLGVTAFVLLLGRLPWRAHDIRSQLDAILSESDPFQVEFEKAYAGMKKEESPEQHAEEEEEGKGKTTTKFENRLNSTLCEGFLPNGIGTCRSLGSILTVCEESKNEESLLNFAETSQLSKSGSALIQDVNEKERRSTRLDTSSTPSFLHLSKDEMLIDSSEVEQMLGKTPGVFHSFHSRHEVLQSTWESDVAHRRTNIVPMDSHSSTATTSGLTPTGSPQMQYSHQLRSSMKSCECPTTTPTVFEDPTHERQTSSTQIDTMLNASSSSPPSTTLPRRLEQGDPGVQSGYIHYRDLALGEDYRLQEKEGVTSSPSQYPTNVAMTGVNNTTLNSSGMGHLSPSFSGKQQAAGTTNANANTVNAMDPVSTVVEGGKKKAKERTGSVSERKLHYLPATKTRKEISAHAIDFIRCCLKVDPLERSTMSDLYKHPWIQELIGSEEETDAPSSPIFSCDTVHCLSHEGDTGNEDRHGRAKEKQVMLNTDYTLSQVVEEEPAASPSGESMATKFSNCDEAKGTLFACVTSNDNDNVSSATTHIFAETSTSVNSTTPKHCNSCTSLNSSFMMAEGLWNHFAHNSTDTTMVPQSYQVRRCSTNRAVSTGTISVSALTSPVKSWAERSRTEPSPVAASQTHLFSQNRQCYNSNSNKVNERNNSVDNYHDKDTIDSSGNHSAKNNDGNPPVDSNVKDGYENQTNHTLSADLASAVTHARAGPRRLRGCEEIAVPYSLAARLRGRHSLQYSCDDSCMAARVFTAALSQAISSEEDVSAQSRTAVMCDELMEERHMSVHHNNNAGAETTSTGGKLHPPMGHKNKDACMGVKRWNVISYYALRRPGCSRGCSCVGKSGCAVLIQASSRTSRGLPLHGKESQPHPYYHRRTLSSPN